MEHFGHVIRGNVIANATRHGISLGSDGGAYYTNCTRQDMTVIERNSISNARMGAILELKPLEWNNGATVDGIPETCENTLMLDNQIR